MDPFWGWRGWGWQGWQGLESAATLVGALAAFASLFIALRLLRREGERDDREAERDEREIERREAERERLERAQAEKVVIWQQVVTWDVGPDTVEVYLRNGSDQPIFWPELEGTIPGTDFLRGDAFWPVGITRAKREKQGLSFNSVWPGEQFLATVGDRPWVPNYPKAHEVSFHLTVYFSDASNRSWAYNVHKRDLQRAATRLEAGNIPGAQKSIHPRRRAVKWWWNRVRRSIAHPGGFMSQAWQWDDRVRRCDHRCWWGGHCRGGAWIPADKCDRHTR